MPYQIESIVDNAIIRIKLVGKIRERDLNPLAQETVEMLDMIQNGSVILWYDINRLESIPPRALWMNRNIQPIINHLAYERMIASGSGDSFVVNFLASTLMALSNISIELFRTDQEAIDFIALIKPQIETKLRTVLGN